MTASPETFARPSVAFWRRPAASIVDLLVVLPAALLVYFGIQFLTRDYLVGLVSPLIVLGIYLAACWLVGGRTAGEVALGYRVEGPRAGLVLRALVPFAMLVVSTLVLAAPFMGYFLSSVASGDTFSIAVSFVHVGYLGLPFAALVFLIAPRGRSVLDRITGTRAVAG